MNPTYNVEYTRQPLKGYKPIADPVKSWIFPETDYNNDDDNIAEAHLADAVARVATNNGMSNNNIMQVFPFILRMLKSKSQWAK